MPLGKKEIAHKITGRFAGLFGRRLGELCRAVCVASAGNVGKEIYGAGESLWMHLMFEALGRVSDRELMLVNLDLLDATHTTQFPSQKLNFVLYNPTPLARSASIKIPPARERPVRFRVNGKAREGTLQVPRQSFIQLTAEY